ncbi:MULTISPECIES: AMP-binding protein [Thermomonosporaceae]|uniref:AMP-binding protein n=1 Tax=Thermomonosporaceae TaxID=2012 RepID=UPI00255AD833|nr:MULTISPECIES: AMP-binding protein [Thermomonosporaceae]MDL4771840.1 AMP-binding protein [Actinomadura xylanilytica]
MTVAALLEARASDDRPGLRRAGGGRAWTWREVVGECAVRAAWMNARGADGGGGRDRRLHVGVLLDNVPELVFLLGGAALSGAVVVALNPTRSAAELAGDAERADCDLILTQSRYAEQAARLADAMPADAPVADAVLDIEGDAYQSALAPHAGAAPPGTAAITPATLLMLIFTSGTSGNPRAVRVTHRKVTVPGENLAGKMLGPTDVVYCPMPLFHSGAIMAAFAPALAAGAELVLRERFSASGLLPDVRAHGCTYLHYVGKALSYVLATPRADGDADNPLKFAFGNEAAPLEQRSFQERFGCFVIDAYGSSETAISLTPDPSGPPGALGRLADGVRILDPETGAECPPARFDEAGRLANGAEAIGELVAAGGHGLFDGYYNDPAPERLRDGMFWSGDHAYADPGGFVFFAGRTAERLRVDGENFGAAQVERVLAEFPGVRQLAVYGVPDAASGDQVMLALAADGFDPEAFGAYLRGRADLGPKWPPRYVRVAAELPATASNKILKRRLARDGWRTGDPVWWRPGRDLAYRRMTLEDVARLRTEFERRGRLHLLEGSG